MRSLTCGMLLASLRKAVLRCDATPLFRRKPKQAPLGRAAICRGRAQYEASHLTMSCYRYKPVVGARAIVRLAYCSARYPAALGAALGRNP
jgi:hypothetical protein